MSKSAYENEDFIEKINGNNSVIRSKETLQLHSFYSSKAERFGLLAAIILENRDRFINLPFEELYLAFPYIEKEKFYNIVKELNGERVVIINRI